jgi:hypothetical protein
MSVFFFLFLVLAIAERIVGEAGGDLGTRFSCW